MPASSINYELFRASKNEILDPGNAGTIVVDRSLCLVNLVSAAAETRTLSRPTKAGAIVTLYGRTLVGTITLTVTGGFNFDGDTTFSFSTTGHYLTLISLYDGTNYFWTELANWSTGTITPTESAWLDGVTPGTAASSKAVVLGTAGEIATITTATVTTANITTLVGSAWNTSAAAGTITVKANTAAALAATDGTTSLYVQDSRNTVTVQNHLFDAPASQTLPNGATSRYRMVTLNAHTVTLAGQTQVTTTNQGATLFLAGPTYNQSGGAVTVDQVTTLHVAVPVAGSSVTITANRHISTGVSDCYLTSGGVWTDTACWAYGKKRIGRAARKAKKAIAQVMEKIVPATWQYKNVLTVPGTDNLGNNVVHKMRIDDRGRERVGIVYDDLPEELRAPGEERGVSTGILASFALAAIKLLWEQNKELQARLARLES